MIRFENAGKAYRIRNKELVWPLRNFTATIHNGQNTCILVPEHGGKTTLIDLAAGNETLSEGSILRGSRISWPFGFKGVFSNKLSGKQNLRFLTDIYGRNFSAAYEFLKEFSELGRYVDLPLKQYNNEQRNRLSISVLFAMNFEFILVDGSMEGGDLRFRRKCAQFIEDNISNFTFFIATGDLKLLNDYCQTAGVLHKGRVTFYDSIGRATREFEKINTADA